MFLLTAENNMFLFWEFVPTLTTTSAATLTDDFWLLLDKDILKDIKFETCKLVILPLGVAKDSKF